MSEWLKVSMRHGSLTRMSPKVEGVLRLPRDSPWPCPHGKTEGQAARDEGDYSAGCRGPGNQESAEKARRGQGWHSPGNRTARRTWARYRCLWADTPSRRRPQAPLESRHKKGRPGWEPHHHSAATPGSAPAVTRLQGQPLPLRTLPPAWTKAGDVAGTGGGCHNRGALALCLPSTLLQAPSTNGPPRALVSAHRPGAAPRWRGLGSRLASGRRRWGQGRPSKAPLPHPPLGASSCRTAPRGLDPCRALPSPGRPVCTQLLSSIR